MKSKNKKGNLSTEFKEKWLNELKDLGISKKDYVQSDNYLSKRFGEKAKERDIIWALMNKALIKCVGDYLKQSHTYYLMGKFVRNEGKNDSNQYFELSTKSLLLNYKSKGMKKVRFVASLSERTCGECNGLNGKSFNIEESLKKIPIPYKGCKNKDDYGYLNCRCAIIMLKEDQ